MPDPISWEFSAPYYLSALIWGYLLGTIPFGLVLVKWRAGFDIRQTGSGNIGATNVLRSSGKILALLTLMLDAGKGWIGVLIALNWGNETGLFAALGALLGHIFPLWLRFNGGKGVATFIGIALAFHFWPALAFGIVWIVVFLIGRMSSLAALVAVLTVPVVFFAISELQIAEAFVLFALILWYTHRSNIRRIIRGQEPRFDLSC